MIDTYYKYKNTNKSNGDNTTATMHVYLLASQIAQCLLSSLSMRIILS